MRLSGAPGPYAGAELAAIQARSASALTRSERPTRTTGISPARISAYALERLMESAAATSDIRRSIRRSDSRAAGRSIAGTLIRCRSYSRVEPRQDGDQSLEFRGQRVELVSLHGGGLSDLRRVVGWDP